MVRQLDQIIYFLRYGRGWERKAQDYSQSFFNKTMRSKSMLNEWRSTLIPIFKNKC